MSYYYVEGTDGRHYCYAKEPSYRCPVGWTDRQGKDDPEPGAFVITETIADGALYLGVDPQFLARKITHSADRSRDEHDKLTEFCVCGRRLSKLGYRYWIEGPPPKDADDSQRATAAMRRALQGSGFIQVEGSWYAKTKKDAQAWARMRAKAAA
jgi:hypothetical protein